MAAYHRTPAKIFHRQAQNCLTSAHIRGDHKQCGVFAASFVIHSGVEVAAFTGTSFEFTPKKQIG
jgi:hypothetical protein